MRKRSLVLALIAILLCALTIRLNLFTGLARGDDYYYARAAFELSQGRTHFDVWSFGTARIGLYAPVALFYKLLGVSEFTTVMFPLLTSLSLVFVIFLLGDLYGGPWVGVLSAMLWAVFPLDVFLATDLLPDGPMAFFYTLSILAYFKLLRAPTKSQRAIWLGVGGLSFVWGLYVKPMILAAAIFFVFHFVISQILPRLVGGLRERGHLRLMSTLLVVLLVGVLLWGITSSELFKLTLFRTAQDLTSQIVLGQANYHDGDQIILHTTLFFVYGPLILAGLFAGLAHAKEIDTLTIWGVFALFYHEWGSFHADITGYFPLRDWVEARYLLYLIPPLIVLAAKFLTYRMDLRILEEVVPVWVGGVVLVTILVKFPGIEIGTTAILKVFSLIAVAALLAKLILLWNSDKKIHSFLSLLTIFSVGIAAFAPSSPYDWRDFTGRREIVVRLNDLYQRLELGSNSQRVFVDTKSPQIPFAFEYMLPVDWVDEFPAATNARLQYVENSAAADYPEGSLLVLLRESSDPPGNARLIDWLQSEGRLSYRVFQIGGFDDAE